jgi:hypothetical protein
MHYNMSYNGITKDYTELSFERVFILEGKGE